MAGSRRGDLRVWTQMFFSEKPLGLGSGWKVVKSEMDVGGRELKIWLDFESGSQFACPRCEKFSPVHDTMEKKWRHLDFWQHRTELIARVPRTNCQEHGILQAAVPWARPGSGFTLMMEAMILLLGQQMSVSAVARHLAESDKRLWRVLEHYVMEAHAAKDWSQVRRLMIDETSARKGHRYVTVVLDAESHDLLLMVEGRSAQAVTEFVAAMPAHRAKAEAITEVVMDMSPAYIAGVQTHFPKARIVYPILGRAIALREALQGVLADGWRGSRCRSQEPPPAGSVEDAKILRARILAALPSISADRLKMSFPSRSCFVRVSPCSRLYIARCLESVSAKTLSMSIAIRGTHKLLLLELILIR